VIRGSSTSLLIGLCARLWPLGRVGAGLELRFRLGKLGCGRSGGGGFPPLRLGGEGSTPSANAGDGARILGAPIVPVLLVLGVIVVAGADVALAAPAFKNGCSMTSLTTMSPSWMKGIGRRLLSSDRMLRILPV
jgi:hypothetical protein